MARFRSGRAARPGLRLPRLRAVRAGTRASLQPQQAAARPVRARHRRRRDLGRRRGRLRARRSRCHERPGLGALRAAEPGCGKPLRLGHRLRPGDPLLRHDHLRDPRQGLQPAPPRRTAGASGHVRRPRDSGRHRSSHQPRHHRRGAAAGPPSRRRRLPSIQGPRQLLGLQHPRVPRPACGLFGRGSRRPAGRPGRRVQGDGESSPRRRPGSNPRRRLQSHGRRQSPRADAVVPRSGQPGLLPPHGRRPALLPGHHRHRQHPQRRQPRLPAPDHGFTALLGHGDARRRLPFRPGRCSRPETRPFRPGLRLLRPRVAGPDRFEGQGDRRAVGCGAVG